MSKVLYAERSSTVVSCGLSIEDTRAWYNKYRTLTMNAKQKGNQNLLSFRQYLKLAVKAGLTSPTQIGNTSGSYQMSRVGDSGDYEVGNCRFLTLEENHAEKHKNGGYKRQAEKLRGRTKETHSGLMGASLKMRGRTKETDRGVAEGARKRSGRTAETHEYVKERTKALSKSFRVKSPFGEVFKGTNLNAFCREHGLNASSMGKVCSGRKTPYRGWTGKYIQKRTHRV